MPDSVGLAVTQNKEQHPALSAVAKVLGTVAQDEWLVMSSWAEVLLWALNRGDSYISIPRDQLNLVRACHTLVGNVDTYAPFILIHNHLYFGRMWQLEQDVAERLYQLSAVSTDLLTSAVAEDLAQWFPTLEGRQQRFAAALALIQHFVVINGGPGTGKTTTVAKLLALLLKHVWSAPYPPQIALAAPTGKAATHMANALQKAVLELDISADIRHRLSLLSGQTVHRLLQLRPPLLVSPFDPDHPLPIDILVVDESSMLDLSLFRVLVRALKPGVRLILLGDANQLSAVGAGNVLAELSQATLLTPSVKKNLSALLPDLNLPLCRADAGMAAHVATLSYSYRFNSTQGIGALASACINGNDADALAAMDTFPQLQWQQADLSVLCRDLYQFHQSWWQAVAANDVSVAFNHLTDIMVLAARKTDASAFNQYYRQYLSIHNHMDTASWFAGMPVLITQNDYDIGLFNGDIGIILTDPKNKEHLLAYFFDGQQYRAIALSRLPQHEPAFSITVHKSQGSEYDNVWLLAPQSYQSSDDPLFNRALLYTALTRARHHFAFCGSAKQMVQAIKNNEKRRSGLTLALEQQFKKNLNLSLF